MEVQLKIFQNLTTLFPNKITRYTCFKSINLGLQLKRRASSCKPQIHKQQQFSAGSWINVFKFTLIGWCHLCAESDSSLCVVRQMTRSFFSLGRLPTSTFNNPQAPRYARWHVRWGYLFSPYFLRHSKFGFRSKKACLFACSGCTFYVGPKIEDVIRLLTHVVCSVGMRHNKIESARRFHTFAKEAYTQIVGL